MLSDKIWVTKKARIYAERRLRRKAFFSEMLMVFYSALLVILSIWNLTHPNKGLDMLLVSGAIVVLVTTVFLSSQRFAERALSMRSCYIRLDGLYSKVKRAEEEKDFKILTHYESEYSGILDNVENHTEYDYLCLRYSLRNNQETTLPKFRIVDYVVFFMHKGLRFLFIVLCVILPIAVPILWSR